MRKRGQQKQIRMGHETALYRNDGPERRLDHGEMTMQNAFQQTHRRLLSQWC